MPAGGVINKFAQLHGDVSFKRTDGAPPEDLDSPIYYSSASRIFMGPVSGGGVGGSFSLGVSTGGNTAGQTGVTGSRIVLAGGGEITLSQATDAAGATISVSAPPQSVQTQNRFNLTLGGNTLGVLQEVSSGTLTLAGGPNITISQNGNAITISGVGSGTGAQSDQTLGLYADGNTTGQSSTTTRDARSVSLRGDGAVSVGFSAGSIRISAPVQSVQPETQTFVGGVAATDATYTSGTVRLLGLGNVTVRSTTGQAIQISVPAQSVQPETQTFVGGLAASDTTYTSGTVRISGVGGGVTVSSNTGQRIDISVAAPVVQTGTQFSAGISGGNTSGDTGTVAGRLVLAGGNNITLSGSTNGASETITISAGSAAAFSGGVSNIGNTAGDTGVTGTRLVFAGGQSITLSQSTNANGGTVTISGASTSQSAQTQDRFNLTLSGNTAGVMAQVSSGTLTLAGGNNITVSQNGNAITISGANVGGAQTGISGIIASDATYTSGTVEMVGSNMVTVKSAGGQKVVIDATQSVQSAGLYALGNTTGQSSSTTRDARSISIRGDGIVSVGYSNGSLRISASQSVQPETQTFIGGISASDTLYTSGTVRFTGVGGGITVSTNTGQRVDLSVAAPVNFSAGVSTGGNTAGDTGVTGTRLVLVGGQSISLSQATDANGGTITFDGATTTPQSNQTAGLYALGNTVGESSSTTRDARSISILGDGIVSVGYSNGSLRISASQSVQPETQTFIGGVANSETTYTSGTVKLSELGAITIRSTTGNQFQLSVNAQTDQSVGLYAVQNTTGQSSSTTRDARSLSFAGDGAASVGFSAGSIRISVPTQTVESQSIGMSNLGNTSGTTGIASGAQVRMLFAGGNNVTLSQSLNGASGTITISAAAQTNQSLGLYALGNTTGQSSSTTRDARSVSVEGAGIVSVGYSGGSLRISASQSVQPETQTFIGGIIGSDATYTSGSVQFTGSNMVTVKSSAGQRIVIDATQSVQTQGQMSAGVSTGGNTAGDTGVTGTRLVFVGSNNITLSQGTAAAGGTITISGPTQTNQSLGMYAVQNTTGQSSSTTMDARTISVAGDGAVSVGYSAGSLRISAPTQTVESQTFGMSNVGNTSGTTGVASGAQLRFVLAGGNNVTLSQSLNGASGTITISAFNQSVQSLGMYAVQNTTGQSSSTTMDARTLSVAGDGAVSVGYSAGSLRISAPTQTVESQSIGMSNVGNTSGTTGVASGGQVRFVFAGGNNITLSQSLNGASGTITISAPNLGAGAMSAGVSNLGNSAGATGITGTQLVLVGSDNITLSQTTGANGGTVSIIGGAGGGFSAGVSTGGNTAGATGVSGTRMVLVGTNAISLSQTTGAAGNTVSIDAPATSSLVGASGISISTNGSTISVYQPNRTQFYPFNDIPIVTGQQGQASLHIAPIHFPNIQHDRLLLGLQISNATNSSNSITISAWAGLYSRNASSISLISSVSTSTNFSGSGTVGSYSLYGGPRWLSIPWTNTVTEDDYWFGIVIRTTTGGGAGHTVSQLCVSKFTNSAWSGLLGQASGATEQYQLGLGVYTVSTSGMPGSIAFTQINGSGSMALREPIFQLRSGTV